MAVSNVQPQYNEYDDRSTSAAFRKTRESQTTTGRLNRADRPENDPYKTELEYGQPATVGQYSEGPWVANTSHKKVKHKPAKAEITTARLKLTAINGWVIGWATFWYVSIQLPFAIISAASIGMAYAVYNTISTVIGETATNYLVEGLVLSVGTISEAITLAAQRLFGFGFDPMLLFITPFALVFLLGLFQLLLTWFIYQAAGIKTLSGQAAGIKSLTFAIVGIGYAIPIFNLFPLIFLWIIFIWKYPK